MVSGKCVVAIMIDVISMQVSIYHMYNIFCDLMIGSNNESKWGFGEI